MTSEITLYCIILSADGIPTSELFGVDLQSGAAVHDLRKEILRQYSLYTKLELFKLGYPLQPNPETLEDDLKNIMIDDPKDPQNRPGARKLTVPMASITEEFYENLGPRNLHIIARIPQGISPSNSASWGLGEGLATLEPSDATSTLEDTQIEKIEALWKSAWNVPLSLLLTTIPSKPLKTKTQEHSIDMELDAEAPSSSKPQNTNAQEPSKEVNVNAEDVLILTHGLTEGPQSQRDILVRKEYIRIYDAITEIQERPRDKVGLPRAVVVTGQPGIGKSTWIAYAIIRRLTEGQPTTWLKNGIYHQFSKFGVRHNTRPKFFRSTGSSEWCFIDSVDDPTGVPKYLVNRFGAMPVYVSSPDDTRWRKLHQGNERYIIIMDPWTSKEIDHAGFNIYGMDEEGMQEPRTRFYADGPTPRICLTYSPAEITAFRKDRRNAIMKASNVHELLTGVMESVSELSKSEDVKRSPRPSKADPHPKLEMSNSHKLCLIRRSDADNMFSEVDVGAMSKRVIIDILDNIRERREQALLELWRTTLGQNTGGMSGILFETYMHLEFGKRIKFNATSMYQKKKGQGVWHAHDPATKNPQPTPTYLPVDFTPRSTICYDDEVIEVEEDTYYRPRSAQQVAIDAFFIHQNQLYLLQYTVSPRHDIKSGLAGFIKRRITPYVPKTQWRFIFVCPNTVTTLQCPKLYGGIANLHPHQARIDIPKDESKRYKHLVVPEDVEQYKAQDYEDDEDDDMENDDDAVEESEGSEEDSEFE